MPDYDVFVLDQAAFAQGKTRLVMALVDNGPWTAATAEDAIAAASKAENRVADYRAYDTTAGVTKHVTYDRTPILTDPPPPAPGNSAGGKP